MTALQHQACPAHEDFVPTSVEALRRLLQLAEAIDLRAAESDKSEPAHESLLRTIVPLLDETYVIISRVALRFEEAGDDPELMEVADIAALAGMALQERRRLLNHVEPCDHWVYLENCERSLRSLRKSASVVEAALTRYGQLPAPAEHSVDLDRSLRVRQRYATLRREISRAATQHHEIQSRLRSVSRSIAALLSCDEFPFMRLGDRRELRMLQFRIQSWLSTECPPVTDGERTWEEVLTVVSLLSGVSRRSELVAHDARVVMQLAAVAAATDDTRALRTAAAPLFGMDPALDVLLDVHVPDGQTREQWQQVISQIQPGR